jgi:hypothetical protein
MAMLVYQTVNLHFPMGFPVFSDFPMGFPMVFPGCSSPLLWVHLYCYMGRERHLTTALAARSRTTTSFYSKRICIL